jgi:tRNA (guanine-N7-)-methyltransferase
MPEDQDTKPEPAGGGEHRYFGRRKGRGMTQRKTALLADLLPSLRLDTSRPCHDDVIALFPVAVRDVWLEIGFGGGEHLAAQAERNPDIGIIGAEPFVTGVAKLVSRIAARGLQNIRIHDDDVRPLLAWLPAASLGRVFVLFPDPWPKRRHEERRIISEATVADLARVLKPGGTLRLATDIADYASRAVRLILASGSFEALAGDTSQPPSDWVPTRYEAKARLAGRRCQYFDFVRI